MCNPVDIDIYFHVSVDERKQIRVFYMEPLINNSTYERHRHLQGFKTVMNSIQIMDLDFMVQNMKHKYIMILHE